MQEVTGMCNQIEFRNRVSLVLSFLQNAGDANLTQLEVSGKYYLAEIHYSDIEIVICYEPGDDYWDITLCPIAATRLPTLSQEFEATRTILAAKSDAEPWLASLRDAEGSDASSDEVNRRNRDFGFEVVKMIKAAITELAGGMG